jgi:hypothetical protein
MALSKGFNQFSDHTVSHEEQPVLLREAYGKHMGEWYFTRDYLKKMLRLRLKNGTRYGDAVRAPNLLADFRRAAPKARILVIVRDPMAYVLSAHYMRVLSKPDDVWDQMRIMPHDEALIARSTLAERITLHWAEVNRYLLHFAEQHPDVKVALYGPLRERVLGWAGFLGVGIRDEAGLMAFFAEKPNASKTKAHPEGYDHAKLEPLFGATWERAQRLAEERAAL